MGENVLQLENITKLYGNTRAVDGSHLEVKRGEVFTLLGPSGCGKTTTLRLIAGLERLDEGRIIYDNQTIADPARGIFVPPHRRNMGMVFQSYAIWPHMTVFDNIAYPLKLRGVGASEVKDRVERVLDLVGMRDLMDRPAPMLSGGEQQRVAISRALVYAPNLLLLDEPFSNLDAQLRGQMRIEVKLLQRRLGITVLFVTHDQLEALTLSDRIAVMNEGQVEQVASPSQMYDRPATPFVRDFLGQTVVIRGVIAQPTSGGIVGFRIGDEPGTAATVYSLNHSLSQVHPGASAYLSIRPEDIQVRPQSQGTGGVDNAVSGVIETLLFGGDHYETRVGLDNGESILMHLPRAGAWAEGQPLLLSLPPESTYIWPA